MSSSCCLRHPTQRDHICLPRDPIRTQILNSYLFYVQTHSIYSYHPNNVRDKTSTKHPRAEATTTSYKTSPEMRHGHFCEVLRYGTTSLARTQTRAGGAHAELDTTRAETTEAWRAGIKFGAFSVGRVVLLKHVVIRFDELASSDISCKLGLVT